MEIWRVKILCQTLSADPVLLQTQQSASVHKCRNLPPVVGGGNANSIGYIAMQNIRKFTIFRIHRSLGWPLFYIYTLTADGRAAGAAGTSLYGGRSGRNLPVPSTSNGRRRQTYKFIADRLCPSLSHVPGWRTGSPYPGLGPSLHRTKSIPNRRGVCVTRKTYLTTR